MAWLKREDKLHPRRKLDNGKMPSETIADVTKAARSLIQHQYDLFNNVLQPELAQEGIFFYRRRNWTDTQKKWIEDYFDRELLPILTPIGLDPSHPFPRPLNKSLNFAVELDGTDAFGRPSGMAIVQAPRILLHPARPRRQTLSRHDGQRLPPIPPHPRQRPDRR